MYNAYLPVLRLSIKYKKVNGKGNNSKSKISIFLQNLIESGNIKLEKEGQGLFYLQERCKLKFKIVN